MRTIPSCSATALFQSATKDTSGRNAFAAELMRHLPVDSYGRFLNNSAIPQPDRGAATKMDLFGGYRFCLALETSEEDYVTETFFQPLRPAFAAKMDLASEEVFLRLVARRLHANSRPQDACAPQPPFGWLGYARASATPAVPVGRLNAPRMAATPAQRASATSWRYSAA